MAFGFFKNRQRAWDVADLLGLPLEDVALCILNRAALILAVCELHSELDPSGELTAISIADGSRASGFEVLPVHLLPPSNPFDFAAVDTMPAAEMTLLAILSGRLALKPLPESTTQLTGF